MNIPLFIFFPRDEDEIIPLSAIPNSERIKCCKKTSDASYKQHLECLKKLRSEGVEWDIETIHHAVINNNLEILKYAHENGCKWDKNTIADAAYHGHLEILKYAHENGCKWDEDTMYCAALKGNLECLKYAHENGCKWDSETTSYAAVNYRLECLLYCLENGCPNHPETLNKLYKRILKNHDEINMNLLTNLLLRKVLLHPKIKNNITKKYPDFVKAIEEYEKYRNKFYIFLESESNLSTDVIKYEVMKYI
jgi:hypothetical protein